MKPLLTGRRAAGALVVAALAGGVWLGRQSAPSETERKTWSAPVVLARVQALGDLRTVRHSYQNVFEYQTERSADPSVASLPLVPAMVGAATRNTALVSATGSVEAGVDLRAAKWERGVLVLPTPRLYPADVRLRVHEERPGMFWRDDNLPPKAEEEARRTFAAVARRDGILDEAKRNAETQIRAVWSSDQPLRIEWR